jgi:hypothetical protein
MKTKATLHLRLTVDIVYEPNGETEARLRNLLGGVVGYAYEHGLLTGDTNANCVSMDDRVERILP